MGKNLAGILEETEEALSNFPTEHWKSLETFEPKDERILRTFFVEEDKGRLFHRKYRTWKALVRPVPKEPSKSFLDQRKRGELLRTYYLLSSDWDGTITPETITTFGGDILTVLTRMNEIGSKEYEGIVTYTKEMASERRINSRRVVKDADSRDEIYRRIYPKPELMEFVRAVNQELATTIMATRYALSVRVSEKQEVLKSAPLLYGILAIYKYIFSMRHPVTPPEEVIKSFLADRKEYGIARRQTIYQTKV